jgi:hypothetical protein
MMFSKVYLALIVTIIFTSVSCASIKKQRRNGSYSFEEQMISDYIWYRIKYDLARQTIYTTPIYVDTNLIFRENMYRSDSSNIFIRIPEICEHIGKVDLSREKGILIFPDSMRSLVGVITGPIDFDIDSLSYYLVSLPIFLKEHNVYAAQIYHSEMSAFHKFLSVDYIYFDKKGKVLSKPPCNETENWKTFITSNYWSLKLNPKPCDIPCQQRKKRFLEAYNQMMLFNRNNK